MRKSVLTLLFLSCVFAAVAAGVGFGVIRWTEFGGPAAGDVPAGRTDIAVVPQDSPVEEANPADSPQRATGSGGVAAPLPPAPGAVSSVASVASPTAPPLAAPPPREAPAAPAGIFNSFAPEDSYGLSAWNVNDTAGGGVVQALVEGPALAPPGERPLTPSDVVVVTGWAGDSLLGQTFSHVLFEVCGKIVGAAAVDEARPDIAEAVHPNLGRSGWSARLAVAHLPRCENAVLKAYATGNPVYLYPFSESYPLPLPGASAPAPIVAGAAPIGPDDFPALDWRRVSVVATGAYLRRCGSTECEPVGMLKGGPQDVLVMSTIDGWSLLVADGQDQAGWMSNKVFETLDKLPSPATAEAPTRG